MGSYLCTVIYGFIEKLKNMLSKYVSVVLKPSNSYISNLRRLVWI